MISVVGTDDLIPKTSQRRPWSQREKSAVWRQLEQYIALQRVPGKVLCLKALKAEPVLKRRDWRDIKNHVYNCIKKENEKKEVFPVHGLRSDLSFCTVQQSVAVGKFQAFMLCLYLFNLSSLLSIDMFVFNTNANGPEKL